MTTDDFNRLFRYHRGGLLEPWRDSPRPHKLRWPAGAPVVAAVALAAWGWW